MDETRNMRRFDKIPGTERGIVHRIGAAYREYMPRAAPKGNDAAPVDVAAVEDHLAKYAVSCPLCRAFGEMAVAHHMCGIASHGPEGEAIAVVLIVCKRCGYLMPLAADRVAPS